MGRVVSLLQTARALVVVADGSVYVTGMTNSAPVSGEDYDFCTVSYSQYGGLLDELVELNPGRDASTRIGRYQNDIFVAGTTTDEEEGVEGIRIVKYSPQPTP